MKTRNIIAVILIVLTVAYCGIGLLAYDASSGVEILCVPGSEAELWAKKHHADYSLISDSELETAKRHLGTFDYNEKDGGYEIVGSHSAAKDLVIPNEIDGVPVTGVDAAAFAGSNHVTAVYVPKTVRWFGPLHTEQYVVFCYEDSPTYDQLQAAMGAKWEAEAIRDAAEAAPGLAAEAEAEAQRCAEEAEAAKTAALAAQMKAEQAEEQAKSSEATSEEIDAAAALIVEAESLQTAADEKQAEAEAAAALAESRKTEAEELAKQLAAIRPETFVVAQRKILVDSDPVNFSVARIPFAYNNTENGLDLTAYTGHETRVIVPETIDGIPVTAISFPVEGIRSVLIPASVTEIRAPLTQPRYDAMFWLNLALVLLGLLIALLATHLAANRCKTKEQKFLGIASVYSGIKYFVLLLIWAAAALICGLGLGLQLLVGAILLAAAPIELIAAGFAGQKVENVSAEVRQNTLFIRAYRSKAEQLQNGAAENVKACCKDVAEAFHYSDPMSHAGLRAVENEIAACFEAYSSAVLTGGEEEVRAQAGKLLLLVEERNRTCKMLK